MKRVVRVLLRVIAALAILIIVAGFVCFDAVDFQPYFRCAYYTNTMAEWRRLAATNTVVRGNLSAGFGRARLTPTLGAATDDAAQGRFHSLPLAGYGNRHGQPATGVHDDLQVSALALQVAGRVVVMVGADALIVPRDVTAEAMARLETELHLRREQLYLGATHSHSSLGGWGEGLVAEAFAGPFNPGVRTWYTDRIVTAVREALGDLKPATVGHGRIAEASFVRNRLVGELGRVDPEFSFLVVRQTGGRVGVLGSFAAHATVLSGDMQQFSADYPGAWVRAVEQLTGGTAVFIAGSVGSHSPVPGAGGLEGVERMGRELGRAVVAALPTTPMTNALALDVVGLDVTLPPLNVRVTDGIRLRPWLARRLLPVASQTYLQTLRLGDSLWISTPCDFSGELTLDLKDSLRTRGFDTTVTSFNGDYIGYVVPGKYYHLDGYEPRVMSFFGPNVPDYLVDLIRRVTAELAGR